MMMMMISNKNSYRTEWYRTFSTSMYSFSSGVGYVMRPILLIMQTAFQSFILRDNNNKIYGRIHDIAFVFIAIIALSVVNFLNFISKVSSTQLELLLFLKKIVDINSSKTQIFGSLLTQSAAHVKRADQITKLATKEILS